MSKRTTRKWDSSRGNSGALPSKAAGGSVEDNAVSSKRRRRKEPSHFEKVELNYNMIKEIMPRMKQKEWLMFNHFIPEDRANSGSETQIFSKVEDNTAGFVRWPAFNHNHLEAAAQDRIPSGHSLTLLDSTDNTELVANAIFPVGHPALIVKGDQIDQRLTDMCNIKGLRIKGVIESFLTHASYDNMKVDTMYLKATPQRAVPNLLDNKRKVRLMVVELHQEGAGISIFDDPKVYADSIWPNTLRSVTQSLAVNNPPRLTNLLELDVTTDLGNAKNPAIMRAGRWQGIDRHYRSNKDNVNVWKDPAFGRLLNFRVLHDVSFNLDAPPSQDFRSNVVAAGRVSGDGPQVVRRAGHYVNVDIMIKNLDWNMSYDIDDTQVTSPDNGSRQIYIYLFDDSMDAVDDISSNQTVLATEILTGVHRYAIADDVVNRGYARTRAYLTGNFFYTDGL